jgi:hypothetical protein
VIEHLVFFRLKPGQPADMADRIVTAFRGLHGVIPGLREVSAGRNTTEETAFAADADIGVRLLFESAAALRAYLPHPHHVRVAELVLPAVEKITVCDFEVP